MSTNANRRAPYPYANACTKVRYDNERRAQAALNQARRQGREEQRAYLCECGGWHLSSKGVRR